MIVVGHIAMRQAPQLGRPSCYCAPGDLVHSFLNARSFERPYNGLESYTKGRRKVVQNSSNRHKERC